MSWKTCLAYLDDVSVAGQMFDEHLQNPLDVFLRLRGENLQMNPKKGSILVRGFLWPLASLKRAFRPG